MILSIVCHLKQAQRLRTKEATNGIFIPINVIQSDGKLRVSGCVTFFCDSEYWKRK